MEGPSPLLVSDLQPDPIVINHFSLPQDNAMVPQHTSNQFDHDQKHFSIDHLETDSQRHYDGCLPLFRKGFNRFESICLQI